MFKKLRRRFIALSMASLLTVLLVILGAVNLMNYRNVIRQADAVLDVLAENGGAFPGRMMEEDLPPLPEASASPEEMQMQPAPYGTPPAQQVDTSQTGDGKQRRDAELSVEAPYESRYFSVFFDADGGVSRVDTGRIAAVDSESAVQYAQTARSGGNARGFVDDYRFVTVAEEDGTLVIFLDCGRSLNTFRSFLLASALTALVGSAAVLALLIAFSGRIVRPVAESYEKQKRFITDAGHEIKTPLAIIDADADVLELDLEDENNEWLADIRRQTKRLTELTNDLVYLSRMEEQQQNLASMVDFPVSDVVSETAQSFQSRAIQKGQRFTQSVQPMLTMNGDEKAIRQLTSILLDNAVKYTPEGGRIELSLEQQGRNLVLSVFNDAASPVPRESMDRLFDRFYRTDPSRSSSTGGHGIGLSIARAVVQAHKGKITASTADEKSLRITAVIPA